MVFHAVPVAGTLAGCMGCMVVVEKIAKEQPSSMNLMTFSTFLFTALYGLVFTSKFFTVPNQIPIRGYLPTVVTFFFVNVINNQALNFHVPVPLHIIFRSGSLLASLVLAVLIQKKSFALRKYLSVFAITLGIVLCTLATSSLEKHSSLNAEEAEKHYKEWIIGILMLTAALLASAYLAICQQRMYEQHGKHPEEATFHALGLPIFAFMWSDISRAAAVFNESPRFNLGGFLDQAFSVSLPSLWVYLLAACVLQYVCIRFVYRMNAEMEALAVTLVVTLRKFLSLLFSIYYFKNPFTFTHWVGTALVFAGTLAFADIWGPKKEEEKKKKKQ